MTTSPPFRADHVGSLLRPPELREAHRAWLDNHLSDAELESIQDRAIHDAVALQEEVGLEAITDGEFRRASYWSRFVDKVDGLTSQPARFSFRDESGSEQDIVATLDSAGRWTCPADAMAEGLLNRLHRLSDYSPAHGRKGVLVLYQAADAWGAHTVEMPPEGDPPPGIDGIDFDY